jgi:hypothetical protein
MAAKGVVLAALLARRPSRSTEIAIKILMDSLVPKANVKRNGNWSEIESTRLVPGDIISFKIGDTVPADCWSPDGRWPGRPVIATMGANQGVSVSGHLFISYAREDQAGWEPELGRPVAAGRRFLACGGFIDLIIAAPEPPKAAPGSRE